MYHSRSLLLLAALSLLSCVTGQQSKAGTFQSALSFFLTLLYTHNWYILYLIFILMCVVLSSISITGCTRSSECDRGRSSNCVC